MSSETMLSNTAGLEEIRAMVNNLPDAGSSDVNAINPDLNLLVLGDSLFGGPIGKEFINGIGCKVQNYARSGATLATISEKASVNASGAIVYNRIIQQLADFVAAVTEERNAGIEAGAGTLAFHEPDIIILDGGGNDYMNGAVMGSLYSAPVPYRTTGSYNVKTVLGALEDVLHNLNKYYPKAQKFFVSMHRVNECYEWTLTDGERRYWASSPCCLRVLYGSNWEILYKKWSDTSRAPYKPITSIAELEAETTIYVTKYTAKDTDGDGKYNTITKAAAAYDKSTLYGSNGKLDNSKIEGNYTYDELRENIIKGCQMYGVRVIDIYNESCLNAIPLITVSPTRQTVVVNGNAADYWFIDDTNTGVSCDVAETIMSSVEVADTTLFDWKGIHPTKLGYDIGYKNYIKEALRFGTKK